MKKFMIVGLRLQLLATWTHVLSLSSVCMRHTNEIIAAVSLALPPNHDTIAKFNILLWWKLKGAPTFPIMSRVAGSVLCILASNSKAESNFSDAGNTLTNKRFGLKPTIVNGLFFVRSNQDLVQVGDTHYTIFEYMGMGGHGWAHVMLCVGMGEHGCNL